MIEIKDSVLLITGGTGSFGNAVLNKFILTNHFSEIRIFSRDEKKQDDMRNDLKNSKLKFFIGDVRDYKSIENAMDGVDYVFHAAALKQVPSCEFFPMEAIKTNVLGTKNVIEAASKNKVKKYGKAQIFGYEVHDPERYGVVDFDKKTGGRKNY